MSYVIAPPRVASVPVAGGGEFPVRRIYCVGRNYAAHAIEMGFSGREPPFFFMKPADAILPAREGETARLPYPPLTKDLHHEVELVAALGSGGSCIAAADALQHVWGYAVGLDMTRRDLQGEAKKQGRPWDTGKGFEASAPIGAIRRAAECDLAGTTRITLDVNGERRQDSTLDQLIWNLGEIIAHLSTLWQLGAGDLVFTGTPEGVAAVVAGDRLQASVEGVGRLDVVVV